MNANEIASKNFIRVNNKLFKVIETNHVKPGKGPAYVFLTLKNLETSNIEKMRFRVNEKIENIFVESKKVNYTYKHGNIFFFIDENGEEIEIREDQIPYKQLITAGMQYIILYAETDIISISLPEELEVKVAYAPPFITGQSATSQLKIIRTMEGFEIEVPQYIKKDDLLLVNSDLQFIKRILPGHISR